MSALSGTWPDATGQSGSRALIPHAKVVELPFEVGPGGDVTDYFARLGKTREDFLRLLDRAHPVPPEAPHSEPAAPQDPEQGRGVLPPGRRGAAPVASHSGRILVAEVLMAIPSAIYL